MNITNYRLQTEIEQLSIDKQKSWFINYLKSLLESDKPYYQKADYKEDEMFTKEQLKTLEAPLDGKRVKRREQGSIALSYLEGYDIIDHANKIFGFDGWSYSINKLEQVSEEINEKNNKVVVYRALITVTVEK